MDRRLRRRALRYFLDTEFNGFGGELISLALVPEHGDQEFYAVLPLPEALHPWVERHVVPYLHNVPPALDERMSRDHAALAAGAFLSRDRDAVIVADWPEDIALLCRLLAPGAREIAVTGNLTFHYVHSPGFSTAVNSKVPHNALHDARALREFILHEESYC